MSELIERANHVYDAAPADELRAAALQSLERKREFRVHLAVFAVVNALLWLAWGLVLAYTGFWFPWPAFPTAGWGLGLGIHSWETYGRRPFTAEQVEREAARLRDGR